MLVNVLNTTHIEVIESMNNSVAQSGNLFSNDFSHRGGEDSGTSEANLNNTKYVEENIK